MLVLLAPSEGKAPPPASALPLDLGTLVHPELTPQRLRLAEALGASSPGARRGR